MSVRDYVPGWPEHPYLYKPKIPFYHGWKAKVGRIDRMYALPCGRNPWILSLAAFVTLPVIVAGFAEYDCIDNAFDRIGRSHRRRRSLFGGYSDVARALPAPPKGGYGWFFFQMAKKFQTAGAIVTVIDGTLNWIIYSTSLAMRWEGCGDPLAPSAELSMDHTVAELLPPAQGTLSSWLVEECGGAFCDPTGFIFQDVENGSAFINIVQHLGNFPPLPDCDFECRVVEIETGRATGWESATPIDDTTRAINLAYVDVTKRRRNRRFKVEFRKTFGVMEVSGKFVGSAYTIELNVFKCGPQPLEK